VSNIVKPNIKLTCNVPAGTIKCYLWFVYTSLANMNAGQAAVDVLIAAGQQVTGYTACSPLPTLQLAPGAGWTFPQAIWAFVVACSVDDEVCTRALDVVAKWAGDGW